MNPTSSKSAIESKGESSTSLAGKEENKINETHQASQERRTGDEPEDGLAEGEYLPCFTCNGFYGPSYEDPICQLCHSLLTNMMPHNVYQTCLPEDKDDEDSGNDEPEEENDRSQGVEPAANEQVVNIQQNNGVDSQIQVVDIEKLPPEVMMVILLYLDDLSMWAAAEVNERWREIIMCRVTTQEYWKNIINVRWPLFEMAGPVNNWFEVYSSLVKSSCCLKCLRQIAMRKLPTEKKCMWRQHRLDTELRTLKNDPPDGIKANPLDSMYCHWIATMKGPGGSPYEGGMFFLYIHIPYSYPLKPPIVRFITKIYHPNISRHGDIGIDSILDNWSLALTICKLLISIQSLLTDPDCEVCMEPKIGRSYIQNRTKYDDTAREWTWRYAMTQLLPH